MPTHSHTDTHMQTRPQTQHSYTLKHTHTFMTTHTHIHSSIHTRTLIYTLTRIHIYTHTHSHTHSCAHALIYTHPYILTCIHTHSYTFTCTLKKIFKYIFFSGGYKLELWLSSWKQWLFFQWPQVQFSVPTRWPTTDCNSSFQGFDSLFWPPQALHSCGAQLHMHNGLSLPYVYSWRSWNSLCSPGWFRLVAPVPAYQLLELQMCTTTPGNT